ncbi:uncharacterized protein LOC106168185 [Lingula anatina]|uniref:Uncharacterized protein LOC106168185 n=1 Tax=Lingula anatina TaxID=7574 RepID=A0A1S3IXB0_LINAN|nr:uncharacterized protein LOC106168185 [Lingula anatina]|eukprot:XP_013402606.1 uncharacterized protein LOC106168185 [Lingula anatina]
MRTVFKCLDANCDGYLTRHDYETTGRRAAGYLGLNGDQCEDVVKQFLYAWDHLDKDIADKVAEEEYVHILFTIVNQDSFRRDLYPTRLATNFNLVDTDGNGLISKEEHAAFYKGMRISAEEANRAFYLMDSNGDGFISLEDCAQVYLEFVFTEDPNNKYNEILGPLVD